MLHHSCVSHFAHEQTGGNLFNYAFKAFSLVLDENPKENSFRGTLKQSSFTISINKTKSFRENIEGLGVLKRPFN